MTTEDSIAPAGADAHLSTAAHPNATPAVLHLEPAPAAPSAGLPAHVDAARLHPNEAAGYLMLAPERWEALKAQCTELVKGRALHSSIDTPARAALIAMKAIEMGVPLSAAWSGMRFIDGEVAILGKLLLRLIYQRATPHGATCQPIAVAAPDDRLRAGWLMGRPGEEPREYWFTIEDAAAAGLTRMWSRKANNGRGEMIDTPAYKKYPDRMLPWRALAKGAAYTFADISQGCLLAEEMAHKDPVFLEAQATEAIAAGPPDTRGTGRPRMEIGKGHPLLEELSELMKAHTTKRSQIAGLSGDTLDEQWYDTTYALKRTELTKQCVKGRFPTEGEAQTMKNKLHAELKRLDDEIAALTVTSPSEPETQAEEGGSADG